MRRAKRKGPPPGEQSARGSNPVLVSASSVRGKGTVPAGGGASGSPGKQRGDFGAPELKMHPSEWTRAGIISEAFCWQGTEAPEGQQ